MGVKVNEAQQGGCDIWGETDVSNYYYMEQNVANKRKYTEWQEITEKEKIHAKWEDQTKEVEQCSPDWGVQFAQEET